MKKDCELIVTIPSLTNLTLVKEVLASPFIKGARWNTGVATPFSPKETLAFLHQTAIANNKEFWVDIKGRQLRVTKWADPLYECIELSHPIEVKGEAFLVLRGDEVVKVVQVVDGNKVYVNPTPRQSVGAGQSVNLIGANVNIKGYLTEKDKEYLAVCKELGINNVMASFVESFEDISEIFSILPTSEVVLKIESKKGVAFIVPDRKLSLMAARDDLYIELDKHPYKMFNALKKIITVDKNAICASRIFTSLEKSRGQIAFSDFIDLESMYSMGYRRFMLCDNVCNYAFNYAVEGWRCFLNE